MEQNNSSMVHEIWPKLKVHTYKVKNPVTAPVRKRIAQNKRNKTKKAIGGGRFMSQRHLAF